MCSITIHGEQRVEDRIGKKIPLEIVNKALEFGIRHCETNGNLRKYMDYLYLAYNKGNNNRIYNEKVFIFQDKVLITVLNLPNQYKTITNKYLKLKKKGRLTNE